MALGDLLLFKHKGIYDAGIEWLTRSDYTHVATDIGGGFLIESYPGIGVRKRIYLENEPNMFRFRHLDADPKVYELNLDWLIAQEGKAYDWPGIAGVAFDEPDLHASQKWFCSCLADVFQRMCGFTWINKDSRLVAPGDLASSAMAQQLPVKEGE